MSVMRVSFHINNPYIGDIIGLSMKILMSLIICETCLGNGDVRVAKLEGDPSVDFRDRSEVHQCWDCDSEGEYYETITDGIVDDGNSHSVH